MKVIERLPHTARSCESIIGWDIFWCRDYNTPDVATYGYTIILSIKDLFFIRKFIKIKSIKEI